MTDEEQKPPESAGARAFRERYEAGSRCWQYLVENKNFLPTTITADEQSIIDWMERGRDRKLTPVEIEFNLEQARSIGEIDCSNESSMTMASPQRMWKHFCRSTGDAGGEVLNGREICDECGQTGVFDGWHHNIYGMMGRYQRLTGFRPIGPHRPLVDQLLLRRCCEACGGRGFLDIDEGSGWRECACCGGGGYFLTGTPAEIAEIQRRIAAEFRWYWVGDEAGPAK